MAWRMEHDGRRVLVVEAGEWREDRVAALTDRALADNHVIVALEREGVRLSGVASLPTYHRGVGDHPFLFVNGRPVRDRLLAGAVRGAYASMLAREIGRASCRDRVCESVSIWVVAGLLKANSSTRTQYRNSV